MPLYMQMYCIINISIVSIENIFNVSRITNTATSGESVGFDYTNVPLM
jgi:hypothetical protein